MSDFATENIFKRTAYYIKRCFILKYILFSADKRMMKIKELLEADGHEVFLHTEDDYMKGDVLILPVPMTDDGVCIKGTDIKISSLADFGGTVTGGLVPKEYPFIKDYFKNEEVEIANAVPTAEGAVELAIKETEIALASATVLITGFGRIAKILSKILKGFDCKIKIAARKADQLAYIKALGFEPADIYNLPSDCDVVINTVPAPVLDKKYIRSLKKSTLIIDLASKPGGCDFEECEKRGIKAIHALSLPSKYAPSTAGEILYKSIVKICK